MKRVLLFALCLLAFSFRVNAADAAATLRTPEQRFIDLENAESPSFRRHVVPMLSRLGCSGRECHGSFQGRGGFRLSLFGYDFEKDHKAITVDSDGGEAEVRVNLKEPEQSLLITKPTMQVQHKGKERFKKGGWEYNLLLKWVRDGAKLDVEQTGEFGHLEVLPTEVVFQKPGDYVQLRVLAHWKDGTVEDVTQITRFRSNDESISTVSDTGRLESKGSGDTHVVAFYDNGVVPIPVMLPVSDQTGSKYPKVATRTKVDELVVNKLRKVGIVPAELCTDAEFLRRVNLDLAGSLPTPDEITRFLADQSPSKREAKIDELLNTPAYAAWWATKICDFTGNNPRVLNTGVANFASQLSRQWYDWVYRRVKENQPYDQLAAGIILASSRSRPDQSYEDYAVEMSSYLRQEHPVDFTERADMPYFWLRNNLRKPEEKALAFSHTFLGVRIECAQCHKHPFDQWTQNDFVQFQAFFVPIVYGSRNDRTEAVTARTVNEQMKQAVTGSDKKTMQKALQDEFVRRVKAGEIAPWQEVYVSDRANKQAARQKDKSKDAKFAGRVLTPKILGGEEVMLNTYNDPRLPLMDWLRNKENPYFARAFVNRLWANYFGRGIVEPADDMNLANPPVNRELIDYLADGFIDHNFDMKWLHKEIVNSDTYQRSWKTNPSNKLDEKNFSHMVLRRLPAEVVIDAIDQAGAASADLAKYKSSVENRAIGPDVQAYSKGKRGGDYSLRIFGKPVREMNCDCERTTDPTLLQTIYTRNDPAMLGAIESGRRGGKSEAWVDELRQTYAPKGDHLRAENGLKRVAEMEQRLKAREPQKPDSDNSEAMQKYEMALKKYQQEQAQLTKRKAELQAALPATKLPDSFNAEKTVQEVFLRTVSRPATNDEMAKALEDITSAGDPINGVRDLLWAMMNTREFTVNH